MISTSDIEYYRTKLIKRGEVQMEPAVKELADWIAMTKEVTVLNVIYDCVNVECRPRIQVILEYGSEIEKFKDETTHSYSEAETDLIIRKFSEILRNREISLNLQNVFVVFSAFEPLAKSEAFYKAKKSDLNNLKDKLNAKEIWEIPSQLGYPAIFVYTNTQLESSSFKQRKSIYINEFFCS